MDIKEAMSATEPSVAGGMIYLAGPMSGTSNFNYPLFEEAAKKLRSKGYNIISPHEHADPAWTYEHCLRQGVILLLKMCDGIALLPGWESSKGARLEVDVAKACGMKVFIAFNDLLIEQK